MRGRPIYEEQTTMRIQLTIGDQTATATLEQNPATRDLVSMLPVTLRMRDLFEREKPGPLPRALSGGVDPVFTYAVGQIAYWPPSHDIAIFYAHDGATIPRPGLIPLGVLDTGLDSLADAGEDFEMTIAAID
ncbi:cyclophilin-like fold protein [Pengzhenrongella sp.]|uniref:cyclophilin-like fold protein n=1 Tax=Pengzhenrongella sp. TaxID=2888820 RepID=UPI002F929191